ncbi:MAG TPA: hypothetical protein ENN69_00840 [Spirochaetia bacterium]|nr:hypothetical protein [Spirochaetia bacterium]
MKSINPKRKKPGFTLDEHRFVGRELFDLRDRILQLYVKTGNAYALKEPAAGLLNRALHALDKARSELENRMFEQHGDAGRIDYYYPGIEVSKLLTLVCNTKETLR